MHMIGSTMFSVTSLTNSSSKLCNYFWTQSCSSMIAHNSHFLQLDGMHGAKTWVQCFSRPTSRSTVVVCTLCYMTELLGEIGMMGGHLLSLILQVCLISTEPGSRAHCGMAIVYCDEATGCIWRVKLEAPRSLNRPYWLGYGCQDNARRWVSWECLI